MKRIIGLFSLVLVVISSLSAYNYQTVYSHRTALFAASGGDVKSMRIDSLKFNGDSILFPLKNIQEFNQNCLTPYGASWLGAKIIIKPGWNYFFNQNNDTIKIKTDAKLNERWTVYSDPNIIMAVFGTVQKIEAVNFLGITDSVKTIIFNGVIATSGMPKKDKALVLRDFDGKTIQISKNYGLIKTFNMLVFPYPNENTKSFMGNWDQYILAGLTNPKLGVQNLTWFDVFDFQPGDEIHTLNRNTPALGSTPTQGFDYKVETIKKYLSRVNYSDSIVYSVEIKERINDTGYSNYISRESIKQNNVFNTLPNLPIISHDTANKYSMNIGTEITKYNPNIYDEIIRSNDLCWHQLLADGCFENNSYIKSLGGPYYSCTGFYGESYDRSMVYYKKGSTTWGVPLLISGINQPKVESNITIFPNPATDKITIANLIDDCSFELLDLKGALLLRSTVNASQNLLNLSPFDKGMYLYRISNNGILLKAGKIVKQ